MPRERKRSSVSVATAELVAERIAAELHLPPLSTPDRERIGEILVEWCAHRTRLALDVERRESDRLRAELERLERDNARLRTLLRREPE